MGKPPSDTVLLKIDHSQNMRKFYTMSVQPNLFGGYSLMRNWGRMGKQGQIRVDLFEKEHEAADAQLRIIASKQKRGYQDRTEVALGSVAG